MLECPKTLRYFSLFLLGVAASLPLQIMWFYGHPFSEWQTIFEKISPMNWIVIALTATTALCVLRASPKTKYLVPVTAAAVAFNNLIIGSLEADYSPLLATMASVGFISAHLLLCQSKIIDLFRHPEKRWWLRPQRVKLTVVVFVNPLNGVAFRSMTYDISETGAFISTGDGVVDVLAPPTGKIKIKTRELAVNERITICLTLGQLRQMRCDARIVRRAKAKGIYPEGLALVFEGLERHQRRELKKFMSTRAS